MIKLEKPRPHSFGRAIAESRFRDQVRAFITIETKLGETGLAKLCQCSEEMVRDFFGGTHDGEAQECRKMIERAIGRYRQQRGLNLPQNYALTDPARIVEATITYAVRERRSTAVLAESGCGKTTAAQSVFVREPNLFYVTCDCNDFRQPAFLTRLAQSLGLTCAERWMGWRKQREITDRLRDGHAVLIVDDAHYLINPNKPARSMALDVLKDVQTITGTPFVLLGVPELWTTLKQRSTGGWFGQLLGRIEFCQVITCEMIQQEDVRKILNSMGVSGTGPALAALTELAHRIGGFRHVEKAARWAKRQGANQLTRDSLQEFFRITGTEGIVIGREIGTSQPAACPRKILAAAP